MQYDPPKKCSMCRGPMQATWIACTAKQILGKDAGYLDRPLIIVPPVMLPAWVCKGTRHEAITFAHTRQDLIDWVQDMTLGNMVEADIPKDILEWVEKPE